MEFNIITWLKVEQSGLMFQGLYHHQLDSKGRASLPASFRKILAGEREESLVIVKIHEQCLRAYPNSSWKQLVDGISKKSTLNPEVARFKRRVVGFAREVSLDKLGRILIPSDLRQKASVDREVVFVGSVQYIEIWSKLQWDLEEAKLDQAFDDEEIFKALDGLEI